MCLMALLLVMGHKLGKKVLQHDRREMWYFIRHPLVFDVNYNIPLITSPNSDILSMLNKWRMEKENQVVV